MKITRKKIKKLIKEALHKSGYYNPPPRNPRMHLGNIGSELEQKIDQLIDSDNEDYQRQGYQFASALQKKDLVIPFEGEPYEDLPYKGNDYLDDNRDYNYKTIANYLGDMYQHLSNNDLEIIKNVEEKNIGIVIARDGPIFMFTDGEYAIGDDELEDMIIKIAAKKKKINHLDVNQHEGMPTFEEAYFKILPAIIKISKSTFVPEYEIDDLGIGHFTGKTLPNGQKEIVFSKPELKSLYDMGKLIIK